MKQVTLEDRLSGDKGVASWSKYGVPAMVERIGVIRGQLHLDALAHRRKPDLDESADATAKAFAYALEDIPTHHLEACFTRAIRAQTDSFPLDAAAVNRQWEGLKQELLQKPLEPEQLALPVARSGLLSLAEWKAKHNLPDSWQLGQPYPPESDLYNKPVPGTLERDQPRYSCLKCLDTGWTRIPYDARTGRHAKLVRCECAA